MIMTLLMIRDRSVHESLYRYGLQFSGESDVLYWACSLIMFGICWFNIISAVFLQLRARAEGEQSAESIGSESFSSEEFNLAERLEQKASSKEEDKDVVISASEHAVEAIGLTDAEELIYSGVDLYFHPDTKGRSFKTDFPDREFKQGELARSYREKRISKDEYAKGLIWAFPSSPEEDLSNKVLDYLEGWLERMSNTEDSLAIVKECHQDKEKWNVLWKKIRRQYEVELQQEAIAA